MNTVNFKEILDTINNFKHYNAWLYHVITPYLKGTVLDIGSGTGSIAEHFIDHPSVDKVILSDANTDFVLALKEQFRKYENFSVITLDISHSGASDNALIGSCDSITCINVLEHIEDDISALVNLKRYLKKEGRLILVVPNFSCLYGSLDQLVGHYRRYDRRDLDNKIIRSGYLPEKNFYFNMAGVFTWFLAGKILRKKRFPPKVCKNLDNCVPLLEKIEKHLKPFFGQSMVRICRLW